MREVVDNKGEILVVDNSTYNLKYLEDMLKDSGYVVRLAPSSKLALRAAKLRAPDLFLLDMRLPDIDGIELCKRLKKIEGLAEIPVIFLSALSEPGIRVKAFEAGGIDYITRPFHAEETIARVNTHITMRKLQQELHDYNSRLNDIVDERTKQISQLNEDLEAFDYSVSNALRVPLRHVIGYTDILLTGEPETKIGESWSRTNLVKVRDSAFYMKDMIDALMRLSRIKGGKTVEQQMNLTDLAKKAFHAATLAHGIKATLVVDQDMEFYGDLFLMNMVIEELIDNAVKFSKDSENPEVEFITYRKDNRKIYSIKDNGIGFNEKRISKIFAPFHSYHSDVNFEGMGLGLATVRRIIKCHGGRIWAHSEEGKSATFSFSFVEE